jgi:seryl-tRNA synthetase
MLDIQLIRQETDAVKSGLEKVGQDPAVIDEVLSLDARRRALQQEGDSLRAKLKVQSKAIGREQNPDERQLLIKAVSVIKDKIKENAAAVPKIEESLTALMLGIPNLPLPEVPVGADDSANIIDGVYGEAATLDFTPKPHWDLMTDLDIIDFERGQKISGSRFYVLKGDGARLQRALISWMLDVHCREHGYTEVYPPCMVRSECLIGTGNLPKFGDNLYRDAEEDYWFIPTAEVPVTNLHRDEILDAESLPKRYVAYTPCFRREKMSHGKDTRGIKRGHQFDKVEMVQVVRPEASRDALEELTGHAKRILELLGLRHRKIKMCTGDLSFVSCMKYDWEAFAPGCDEWLEVSSCGLFADFQARRAKIRFKDTDKKNKFVHTLNGSGLALPRVVIAIIETYQRRDGSIVIPEVLRPYMGGQTAIVKSD